MPFFRTICFQVCRYSRIALWGERPLRDGRGLEETCTAPNREAAREDRSSVQMDRIHYDRVFTFPGLMDG